MRKRWGRTSAILGLLVAIFSDLRRRAWWAYRARGMHAHAPRTTIVARRPAERQSYVPVATAEWRPLLQGALPVVTTALSTREQADPLPVVVVDVADRPDIADLPRVLESERGGGIDPSLLGTQWLMDHAAGRAVLIVTFVEPVACTFAISFAVPRHLSVLHPVAGNGELFVTWEGPSPIDVDMPDMHPRAEGLLLTLGGSARIQLRAILAAWQARPAVE